ncbi:MAG: hypothetical protein SGBAC_002179 [Bacillariaceae sp.]
MSKASTTTTYKYASVSNHSYAAAKTSILESESSVSVSTSHIATVNVSIDESELSVVESKNFTLDDMVKVSSNTHVLGVASNTTNQEQIFSYARTDRSGAAIHDMIMCHALAFSRGVKYVGGCVKKNTKFDTRLVQPRKELLRMLGVDFHFYKKCPKGAKVVPAIEYFDHAELFTDEYMDHLRNTSTPSVDLGPQQRPPRITVHIRRGDVTPCGKNTSGYFRYLPNQHYLTLIDRYKEELSHRMNHTSAKYSSSEIDVLIFSESKSYESFDAFRNLGYTVVLDGHLQTVWKRIVFETDVVILSRSSFSMVPGIFSQALSPDPTTVVYTPFWHDPLNQFDNAGDLYPELVKSTAVELQQMRSSCRKSTT